MTTSFHRCEATEWTSLWTASTLGFVYLWNAESETVRVRWRAYYTSPFFYSSGKISADPGRNFVWFGPASAYASFEVRPAVTAFLRCT